MKDYQRSAEQMMEDTREKVIVDLREKSEFEKNRCPESIHIHWSEFDVRNPVIEKGKPLYLLCYTGETSDEIAENLQKEGYEAYSIAEGFRGYLRWRLSHL